MKININEINKKNKILNRKLIRMEKLLKIKKFIIYGSLISFPLVFLIYVLNSSGMFKKLRLDQRYKNRSKYKDQEFGIDQFKNNVMINEFEKKYDINYCIDEYEKRIKFGNKEINQIEVPENEPISYQEINREISDPTIINTNFIFDENLNRK